MAEIQRSPYKQLLHDPNFKRWFRNLERGSPALAYELLRRLGFIQKKFGKSPEELAKMEQRQATNFVLDVVSSLEEEKLSGGYIHNYVKALKNWFDFNGIQITQKIRVKGSDEAVRYSDERPPTPEELRRILSMADFRAKVASSLIAFSGMRIEVLGDFLGDDGLKLKDFPELNLSGKSVDFREIPTMVMVRKALSKTKNQYLTFVCEEGCDYLTQYLEWRMNEGEALTPASPLITPGKYHSQLRGKHIRTTNISDQIRKAIRDAGFSWRPYVLRRYFDTRMMMAESDGLLIRDYRTFWMGHKGDIEHTYTVNKGLSQDVIEKMREAYGKAAEKYLVTGKKAGVTQDQVIKTFNEQFLRMAGYTDEELTQVGDLSTMNPQEIQELIRKKSMQALGLNCNNQKVIHMSEVKGYVAEGWEYVTALPNNEAVIRLPHPQVS